MLQSLVCRGQVRPAKRSLESACSAKGLPLISLRSSQMLPFRHWLSCHLRHVSGGLQTFSALSPPSFEQCAVLTEGLHLAGRLLEAPRFHATGWSEGQIFQSTDDPDRCNEPWDVPGFVRRKCPHAQKARTIVRELQLPPRTGFPGSFARIVHNVLEEQDCAELISRANVKGYTPALLNIGSGRQVLHPEIRDGFRVILDSTELAAWLFQVLRPHLPEEWRGEPLMDFNARCRFLCYTPGQQFEAHCDGRFRRPSGGRSCVTVQLYLHDVPAQNGGATQFVSKNVRVACQPVAGSALLFSQDLKHEGALLRSGLKYTMRTEAMYGTWAL